MISDFSKESSWTLKRSSSWEAPRAKIRISIHLVFELFVFSIFSMCCMLIFFKCLFDFCFSGH